MLLIDDGGGGGEEGLALRGTCQTTFTSTFYNKRNLFGKTH